MYSYNYLCFFKYVIVVVSKCVIVVLLLQTNFTVIIDQANESAIKIKVVEIRRSHQGKADQEARLLQVRAALVLILLDPGLVRDIVVETEIGPGLSTEEIMLICYYYTSPFR